MDQDRCYVTRARDEDGQDDPDEPHNVRVPPEMLSTFSLALCPCHLPASRYRSFSDGVNIILDRIPFVKLCAAKHQPREKLIRQTPLEAYIIEL